LDEAGRLEQFFLCAAAPNADRLEELFSDLGERLVIRAAAEAVEDGDFL
jgi:hypothetical protein